MACAVFPSLGYCYQWSLTSLILVIARLLDPSSEEVTKTFILCRSQARKEKDKAIVERAATKIAERLSSIKDGPEIRNRCVARPTEHQRILLEKLGLNLPTGIRESKM